MLLGKLLGRIHRPGFIECLAAAFPRVFPISRQGFGSDIFLIERHGIQRNSIFLKSVTKSVAVFGDRKLPALGRKPDRRYLNLRHVGTARKKQSYRNDRCNDQCADTFFITVSFPYHNHKNVFLYIG